MCKFQAMGAVLFVLGAAACVAADAPADSESACRLKSFGSLDLEISSEGYVLVPVSLNGTDAWMTLNTALAFTTISDASVTAFNLKPHAISSQVQISSGGLKMTQQVTVDLLKIGNVNYRKTDLAVAPRKEEGLPAIEMGRPVVGSMGINVFDNVDFELNLAGRKLVLFSQEHCRGHVVYWTRTYTQIPFEKDPIGTIVFPMELDGKKVAATISTGALLSAIDSNITSKVYGFDENSPGVTREKSDAGVEQPRIKAMALTAPGLNITNTPMRLVRGSKDCGLEWKTTAGGKAAGYERCSGILPLRLGMNVLTQLRIYVATKEKVLYASRADAT